MSDPRHLIPGRLPERRDTFVVSKRLKGRVCLGIKSVGRWWELSPAEARRLGAPLMQVAAELEEDPADEVIPYGRDQTERQSQHGCFEIFKLRGWVWFGIPSLSKRWPFSPAEARSLGAGLMQVAAEAEEDPSNELRERSALDAIPNNDPDSPPEPDPQEPGDPS